MDTAIDKHVVRVPVPGRESQKETVPESGIVDANCYT
jgi:hypothetical protein